MPGRDGTGPMSMGPLTGRGAGYCRPGRRSALRNPGFGPGFGRRRLRRTEGIAACAQIAYRLAARRAAENEQR